MPTKVFKRIGRFRKGSHQAILISWGVISPKLSSIIWQRKKAIHGFTQVLPWLANRLLTLLKG
jgi:hypothetical protein